MTIIIDITKQDLLDMIEDRLKMFSLPHVGLEYTQLAETIRNEFDDTEPIHLSFEGNKGESVRAMLIGVLLQGFYCNMKAEE